ncbi:uncharacterized protein DS421_6g183130 [Arachis hypogaea]|nr:uncharacterized protein DS421_6g183130 [Arachis hypogaea]
MEVNSLGLFWISMAPQIQGMSTVVDRRGGSGPFSQLAQELYVTEEVVETRVQSAKVLGKFFVVFLSLLNNFMFNFMLNGSSTSLLVVKVDIRAQNAGLLRKYFVVLLSYVLGGHLLAAGFHYFVFVETRLQIAGFLRKYFVLLLRLRSECRLQDSWGTSLLTNFMLNFMFNGSSTSLLVEIRVQIAGLLRK